MCLDTLNRNKKAYPKWKVCYKIFARYPRKRSLCSPCTSSPRSFLEGETYVDHARGKILASCGRRYQLGFHAYGTEADAKLCFLTGESGRVIRKIRLSSIVAVGAQCGLKVYVGRKMYIFPREKKT